VAGGARAVDVEARDPLVCPERRAPIAFGVLDSGFVVWGLGFWGFQGFEARDPLVCPERRPPAMCLSIYLGIW
jgi:hypothetical protein